VRTTQLGENQVCTIWKIGGDVHLRQGGKGRVLITPTVLLRNVSDDADDLVCTAAHHFELAAERILTRRDVVL
jgi:hypothetical protein